MSTVQEALKWLFNNCLTNALMLFSEWFEEFVADRWDKKIEADILAGRLDAAGNELNDDFLA